MHEVTMHPASAILSRVSTCDAPHTQSSKLPEGSPAGPGFVRLSWPGVVLTGRAVGLRGDPVAKVAAALRHDRTPGRGGGTGDLLPVAEARRDLQARG